MKAGDIVEYKSKDYLAIKVNEKSAYICENRNFLNLWGNRAKGITWKNLCEREGAFKVKPENLKLKEEGAVKVKEKKSGKKKVVSNDGEKWLIESFDRFKKQKKGKSTKTPKFLIESSNEKLSIMEGNVEKNMIFFHNISVGSFYFFNVEESSYTKFNEKIHKSGKDIIWPETQEV